MTELYESSNNMNTLTEQAYERIEQELDEQIEYWRDERAGVALGQFLGGDQEGSQELERINGEIFMGKGLKTLLEASVGEDINTGNAYNLVQSYLQNQSYRV